MNGNKMVVRSGIDIGQNSFHLWGVNEQDERVVKKKGWWLMYELILSP